jgi:hypothetical protein
LRDLSWIGLPKELVIPEHECIVVSEYTSTAYYKYCDVGYSARVLFNPTTQIFYKIIKEGTTGPEFRRYAHIS